jgi:hypothetical protein
MNSAAGWLIQRSLLCSDGFKSIPNEFNYTEDELSSPKPRLATIDLKSAKAFPVGLLEADRQHSASTGTLSAPALTCHMYFRSRSTTKRRMGSAPSPHTSSCAKKASSRSTTHSGRSSGIQWPQFSAIPPRTSVATRRHDSMAPMPRPRPRVPP